MTHMSKDDLKAALELSATLAWADELLTKAQAAMKSPKGDIAGQVEELRLRLKTHRDNVEGIEPVRHHRMFERTAPFMAKFGLTEFVSHTGHAYASDYVYVAEVEDVAKAIETIERFEHHVERAYLVKKRGTSFVPECRHKDDHHGEPVETVAYWAELEAYDGRASVNAYISLRDEADTVIRLELRTKVDGFGAKHWPAVHERGRVVRPETWTYFDRTGYFPRSIKFYAPAGQRNQFYGY